MMLRANSPRRCRWRQRAACVAPLSLLIAPLAQAGFQAAAPPGDAPAASPSAPTVTATDPASLPSRYRDALAILTDAESSEARRLEAARALATASTDAARSAVVALLADAEADSAATLLLRALGETFNPAFRSALLAGIQPDTGWTDSRRARAIGVLALDQSRDTVGALIDRLAPAEAPAVRSAATAALIRITGRDDDEARRRGSREAWAAWFQHKALLPENLWLADLATNCAARADRLAAARRDVEAQYRAAMEKLYSASDADERQAMLHDMLREPLVAIRQLGLDLVERALDGSQRISRPTSDQIIELLADPAPDIRGRAALLLDRLRPEGAGAAVAEALLREKDPEVAGRLLLALRNWPTPVTRDPTLRWLAFDDPVVRRRAARALLAAIEAGVLTREQDYQTIVATLRKPAPEALSEESMQLLADLGDTGDREIIASLLTGPQPGARRRAALALADHADFRPRLLEAAAGDPELLPVVVDIVARNRPTLADYDALAAIIPPAAPRDEHLATIARALPVTALVEVAARDCRARAAAADGPAPTPGAADVAPGPPSAGYTERILARCLETARSINGARPDEAGALARGLLLLGQVRLSLDRPDTALTAIEAIHPAWDPELAPEVTHTRALALLLLGRLDDPRLQDAAPEAWLAALDRCIQRQLPHTRDLHAAATQLASAFTGPQRERLDELAAQLPAAPATDPAESTPGERETAAPPADPTGGG